MFGTRHQPAPPVPPVKIGERFFYLDVEMICVRHRCFEYEHVPVIWAHYFDAEGVLRETIFPPVDWKAIESELKQEQPKCQTSL